MTTPTLSDLLYTVPLAELRQMQAAQALAALNQAERAWQANPTEANGAAYVQAGLLYHAALDNMKGLTK